MSVGRLRGWKGDNGLNDMSNRSRVRLLCVGGFKRKNEFLKKNIS
jgi:hypothetical protein